MARFRRLHLARPACPSRRAPLRSTTALLCLALLPALLLFAQYGEYRHELTHYASRAANSEKKAPTQADHCVLCLAYGHVSGIAKPEVVSAPLLADLRFHRRADGAFASASQAPPTTRNRGPPTA
jgi:hypothetical protein